MPTIHRLSILALAIAASGYAYSFDSGSTGADGAFSPTANTVVPLPPSGIFNYTTVNIPAGVTVTYQRNAANTPVVILASGNVTILGTIDISGTSAATNTNYSNDGQPGVGGPGGYDGGQGGSMADGGGMGGNGLGPGGGVRGIYYTCSGYGYGQGASGAGYGSVGGVGNAAWGCPLPPVPPGGPSYGSAMLLPFLGGSGGGGGGANGSLRGTGGGGGGGAILIASSGTADFGTTGRVLANAGRGGLGPNNTASPYGCGGGGSGGAIRVVATTIAGTGQFQVYGGTGGLCSSSQSWGQPGGGGGAGRIRLEASSVSYSGASSTPVVVVSYSQGPVFVPGLPTLKITSVGGVNVPASPTGNMDVTLPATAPSSVTVTFEASSVPLGSTVSLMLMPPFGAPSTVQSSPLAGTNSTSTASASVTVPIGHTIFVATVTYIVIASIGDDLSRFANNERVERVTITAELGGRSRVRLITVSGKEYDAPEEAQRIAAAG